MLLLQPDLLLLAQLQRTAQEQRQKHQLLKVEAAEQQ
jgi:hypothetical protein